MTLSLVVMAAGRGSRFGGMKQVAGLGPSGESLFDYAVFDARRAGFDEFVFVVSGESRPAVQEHVDAGLGRHLPVSYVEQDTGGREKPWGTGHAVLIASAAVDGSFGVVNADDFYGRQSFALLAQELGKPDPEHLAIGFRLKETLSPNGGVSRGVCEVDGDSLASISELHDVVADNGSVRCREGIPLTGDEIVSVNLWGFRPSFARVLDTEFSRFLDAHREDPDAEFLIGDGIGKLEAHGDPPVRVVPTPERFLGVTYREDVEGVQQRLASLVDEGEYPTPLWP